MEKPIIAKHVFSVVRKQHITPHYIRVYLTGPGSNDFAQCTSGANNKIFIPPAGIKEVQFSTFDSVKGEWVMPDEMYKPIVRTYTHRAVNIEKNEIVIDFVNHGENGPASAWANKAQKGDQLGVAMKLRKTVLYPASDWYFLIGDATAIPVISCILESLSSSAKGICLIEVASEADRHPDIAHPGFDIHWVYNEHPEKGSRLAQEAKAIKIPNTGSLFAYVACEFSTVRVLRSYFRDELQWNNQQFYAFSYWKAGVAEDKSAIDRRTEKEDEVSKKGH